MNHKELNQLPLIERMEYLELQLKCCIDAAKMGVWYVQDAGPALTGYPTTHLMDIGDFSIHARFPDPIPEQEKKH